MPRAARNRTTSGSPPHAWGRPRHAVVLPGLFRFTPTRLGPAAWARSTSRAPTVHPHTRGDGIVVQQVYRHRVGSPPHAWGRHEHRVRLEAPVRFTPTRVGTARDTFSSFAPMFGSPPHAWGAQELVEFVGAQVRFTPTHARRSVRPSSAVTAPYGGSFANRSEEYILISSKTLLSKIASPRFRGVRIATHCSLVVGPGAQRSHRGIAART